MTDRELLEFAAKAAGYKTTHTRNAERMLLDPPINAMVVHEGDLILSTGWDPLENDGDALRLAVKLRIEIYVCDSGIAVRTPTGVKVLVTSRDNQDEYAATRRAIVRAAAEIGKETK